jgi:N-methylhydantoinase B
MEGRQDVVIKAAVTVQDGGIAVDLGGSSGQVDWGGNVVYNFTYAYVFMALKSMFDPELPNNHGCSKPITLTAPEGSIVNCKFPAAVAARMQIGHFVTEVIYRALAEVLPDRVIAASGGTPAAMNVFYGKRNDGRPFHSVIIRGGGMGAGADNDGPHVYIFPANGANTPVEIFESDTPLIVTERSITADSGGPGKRRGGLGKVEIFRIPDDSSAPSGPVNLGIQAGRFRYPAEGLSNGKSGSKAAFWVNGKAGNPFGLTRLNPGDVLTMSAAGGGGFGDPFAREPEAVLEDVIDGYVSIDFARQHYGVAIKADTWQIDLPATQALRNNR